MKDFRSLKVWERAHNLVLDVYKTTKSFPKEEQYGLTPQIRRSSSSIPTNIAEGCGKIGDVDFRRYLIIAMGSASELEYQLLLAKDLKYIDTTQYEILQSKLIEIRKMLNGLIQKLTAKS
jgi:four helix bundle protein